MDHIWQTSPQSLSPSHHHTHTQNNNIFILAFMFLICLKAWMSSYLKMIVLTALYWTQWLRFSTATKRLSSNPLKWSLQPSIALLYGLCSVFPWECLMWKFSSSFFKPFSSFLSRSHCFSSLTLSTHPSLFLSITSSVPELITSGLAAFFPHLLLNYVISAHSA